jgi:peptidoglycan/LPS O-acetylase OafA/YrhL
MSPKPERLDALNGVRGVAAVGIVLFHVVHTKVPVFPQWHPLAWFLGTLFERGHLGVDLFFVLSGFVLAHTHLESIRPLDLRGYGRFLRKRVARTYPAYLASLLLLCLLILAIRSNGGSAWQHLTATTVVTNVFLLQQWRNIPSIDSPAWALSALYGAYLAFPVIAAGVRRMRSTAACAAGVVSVMGVLLAGIAVVPQDSRFLRICCEFVAGCLLYKVYLALPRSPRWGWLTTATLLVFAVTIFLAPALGHPRVADVWIRPLVVPLVLGLALGGGSVARSLARPWALSLGAVSFSLFLTHAIVLQGLGFLLPAREFADAGAATRLGLLVIYGAATAAVAIVTYRLVERPGRTWIVGLSRNRPGSAGGPARESPVAQRAPAAGAQIGSEEPAADAAA